MTAAILAQEQGCPPEVLQVQAPRTASLKSKTNHRLSINVHTTMQEMPNDLAKNILKLQRECKGQGNHATKIQA